MISFITYKTELFENGAASIQANEELKLYNPELAISYRSYSLRNLSGNAGLNK